MQRLITVSPWAPFRVRSFRFQWPSDLLTSWAFEMETIILGWYVIVHTESVLLLTVFGSLQFIGTLFAPMLGVVADKVPRRTVLYTMRALFTLISCVLMVLALTDQLTLIYVFALSALSGLIRPSDLVIRNSLIGDSMPADCLTNAMGLARTTWDSARIFGALMGAGLFYLLGIGYAFVAVTVVYGIAFLLSLGVHKGRPIPVQAEAAALMSAPRAFWHDLKDGMVYVYRSPQVLALMLLAFFVNVFAYPITHGLLPYVAKEIYLLDENGLAHLVAAFSVGALIASILMAVIGGTRYSARSAFLQSLIWFVLLLLFSQAGTKDVALVLLVLIGMAQGFAMLAVFIALLTTTEAAFRGRVLGVRSLAIYGLPIGLVLSGFIIEGIGFEATVLLYSLTGIVLTVLVAIKWYKDVWH